jgi:hypothetical protein
MYSIPKNIPEANYLYSLKKHKKMTIAQISKETGVAPHRARKLVKTMEYYMERLFTLPSTEKAIDELRRQYNKILKQRETKFESILDLYLEEARKAQKAAALLNAGIRQTLNDRCMIESHSDKTKIELIDEISRLKKSIYEMNELFAKEYGKKP